MGGSLLNKVQKWIIMTPFRSLEAAFRAAQNIKSIEDQYYEGKTVGSSNAHGGTIHQFFQTQVKENLKTVEIRLKEFRASSSWLIRHIKNTPALSGIELEKLNFIDSIRERYQSINNRNKEYSVIPDHEVIIEGTTIPFDSVVKREIPSDKNDTKISSKSQLKTTDISTNTINKKQLIPPSIISAVNRIRKELSPDIKYENEAVYNFRESRNLTRASARILLVLVVVPLFAQIVTKNLVFEPLVHHLVTKPQTEIKLNRESKENVLKELAFFRESLELDHLIESDPEAAAIEDTNKERLLKEKAVEIMQQFHHESSEGLVNALADLLSLGAFALIIIFRKEDIQKLKLFMGQLISGLSDSAKAFIIILFTDVFVGFHSPHGWEVLLTSVSRHFGLPENREFHYIFIATFPVFLDTWFKYWIFCYLSSLSPSSLATYKDMNE